MNDAEQLGADLQAARESRDLTLAAVEQQTRIRSYYLEALENGDFEVLPSPMQGRGFLRNYARVIGLDPELMAARFDAAIAAGGRRTRGRTPQASPPIDMDSPYPARPPRTKTEPRRPNPIVGSESRSAPNTPPPGAYGVGGTPDRVEAERSIPGYVSPYAGGTPPTGRAGGRSNRTSRSTRRRVPPGTPPGADRAEARQRRTRNTTMLTIIILVVSLGALSVLLWYAVQGNAPLIAVPGLTLGPTVDEASVGATASAASLAAGVRDGNLSPTPARPSALPNPSTIQAQAAGTQGPGQAQEVNVQITIKERSQLRVYIDGKPDPIYSGSDAPGTVLQYSSKTSVRIECSDGAGIEVTVNGVPQGELGQRKQKIDQTFTLESLNAQPTAAPPTLQASAPNVNDVNASNTANTTITANSANSPGDALAPTMARVAMTSSVVAGTGGDSSASNPALAANSTQTETTGAAPAVATDTPLPIIPTRAPATNTQPPAPTVSPAPSPTARPPTATVSPPTLTPTATLTITPTRTGIFLFPATITAESRPN